MFPIPFTLLLFLIFLAWFTYERKKHFYDGVKKTDEFWDNENKANNTRKQPLDDLPYINLSLDSLPIGVHKDMLLNEQEDILLSLKDAHICNLSAYTNTDLKLKYGVANLSVLTDYDTNYQNMAITIKNISERLLSLGFEAEAVTYMEYAVAIGVDITSIYKQLANIYAKKGEQEKLTLLIEAAKKTNTLLTTKLVEELSAIMKNNAVNLL